MAKKGIKKVVVEAPKLTKLETYEGNYFQNLMNASGTYGKLQENELNYSFAIKKLQANRKDIQTGKVKLPVQITLIPKVMSYSENDKKKVLKLFDDQIKLYRKTLDEIKNQLEGQYKMYVASGVSTTDFLVNKFGNAKPQEELFEPIPQEKRKQVAKAKVARKTKNSLKI